MATITINVDGKGLLDYAKAGREAVNAVKKGVRLVMNAGRKEARQKIAGQFARRTGVLMRQSRRMQTPVSVNQAEIRGRILPIPRLMNIFERGAHLRNGGYLSPRPVITPAASLMEKQAPAEFHKIMSGIGK